MLAGLAAFVVLGGFYLLCAGVTTVDEDAAAAITAGLAAAYATLVRAKAGRRFALGAPWHRVICTPVLQLAPDAWRVAQVLAHGLIGPAGRGRMVRQPFRHGGRGPSDAGRRALVTLSLSVAPNTYAADLPDGAEALLLHQLAQAASSPDREWPL